MSNYEKTAQIERKSNSGLPFVKLPLQLSTRELGLQITLPQKEHSDWGEHGRV